jgi:CheY-like chemotaxis protein
MATGTVLYVEDEEFDVLFMRRAFQRAGLEQHLKVVADGQQALDYLGGSAPYADRTQHPLPSVIVLDINLPFVSGFDVLKWIREKPEVRPTPVVMFSSSARLEDRTRASELGANEYVEKPGSPSGFSTLVDKLKEQWLP